MSIVKLQEILDKAIKTPDYSSISKNAEKYINELKIEAEKEYPNDTNMQMAVELGKMRGRYEHDLALLIGHIVEINKLSNKL